VTKIKKVKIAIVPQESIISPFLYLSAGIVFFVGWKKKALVNVTMSFSSSAISCL
jgi:hypothetical protein